MAAFRTDCLKLRKWLDVRKRTLHKKRLPHESKWRDIRKNFCPTLGKSLDSAEWDTNDRDAQRDDEAIYNSTPVIQHEKLAAGLQSGITNQARQWFVFRARNEKAADSAAVRQYLGKITNYAHDRINGSNIYAALDQIYRRLAAFGQSVALLVPDDEMVMRLIVSDEGSYWISEDRRGRVNQLMRRLRYTLSQMEDDFGRDALTDAMREALDKGELEEERTVWHLVFPVRALPNDLVIYDIPNDREYASVYWLESGNAECGGILAIRSYDYCPIIAPRWEVNGLSPYGHGPGEKGLGDAKELQRLELSSLRISEMESNPPYAVPSSLRGEAIDTGPGGLVFYDPIAAGSDRIPIGSLFQTPGNASLVEQKIQAVTDRLNRIFYVDLFAMLLNLEMRQQPRTAAEVNELAQEKVSLLGPVLTRLNQDLLKPLVDGVWHLAYAKVIEDAQAAGGDATGILDAPEALLIGIAPDADGRTDALEIKYTSTLHAEQEATARLSGPFRFIEFYGGVANVLQRPDLADNVDGDKLLRGAASVLDAEGYIVDEDKVKKIRKERAEAQEKAAMAERDALAAKAQQERAASVRDLADAQLTDGGTALDVIAGAQGVGI